MRVAKGHLEWRTFGEAHDYATSDKTALLYSLLEYLSFSTHTDFLFDL